MRGKGLFVFFALVTMASGQGISAGSATTLPTSANGIYTDSSARPLAQTVTQLIAEWVAVDSSCGTSPSTKVPVMSGNCATIASAYTAITGLPTLTMLGNNTGGTANGIALTVAQSQAMLGINAPAPAVAGSIISANFANSANAGKFFPGNIANSGPTGCGSNKPQLWPISGYLRNITITTSSTAGNVAMKGGVDVDCVEGTTVLMTGGAFALPASTAGGYSDPITANSYHATRGGNVAIGDSKQQAGGTAANVTNVSVEFVADSGVWTIFPASVSSLFSASSNNFLGPWGAIASPTELARSIPMPVPGAVGNAAMCTDSGVTTNAVTATININGTPSANTYTIGAGAAAASCFADFTHTPSVAAGDYVSTEFVTGAATQTTYGVGAFGFSPASGSTVVIGGDIDNTVTTTATYNAPLSKTTSTTSGGPDASLSLPRACTISKLYVMQVTANGGGVTTTFTVEKNGADTAVTGTITSASVNALGGTGTGSIPVDVTHSVAFAKGDLLSLKYITGSGTSGTIGAWAVACD